MRESRETMGELRFLNDSNQQMATIVAKEIARIELEKRDMAVEQKIAEVMFGSLMLIAIDLTGLNRETLMQKVIADMERMV